MNLYGKTIVVTGACSGIGAEAVRLLRSRGARVIGMDRNDPMLTMDGFVKVDMSEQASIDAAIRQLPEHIDALCNSAGVSGTAPVNAVARVNYLGLRHLCESVLDRMPQGGSIINIASILGYFYRDRLDQHKALASVEGFEAGLAWVARNPVSQATCYEYFKEALIVWSMQRGHAIFMEKGIRVNCVAPGPVFTPILGEFMTQLGEKRVQADSSRVKRPAMADEIAPAIAFLCSDDSRWISGANLPVDGGFAATYL